LARQLGYTQEQIDALRPDLEDGFFEPALGAALEYATRMTRDPHEVTDELFEELRRHYSDTRILELSCVVAMANYFNRLTAALRVDLSGSDIPYDEADPVP